MINWIKASEKQPPFNERILVVLGSFAKDPWQIREMATCIIVKDSPNDDDPMSEYRALQAGEYEYGDFQFFLVPPDNYYAMPIDVDIHGDGLFMDLYSDAISHWAPLPDFPEYDG